MKQDIEKLKTAVTKLRADLMASNLALQAILTAMPLDDQKQALKALAQLSVMQEQFAEKTQTPAAQEQMKTVVQATDRLYQALQGAHKMRAATLNKGEGPSAG